MSFKKLRALFGALSLCVCASSHAGLINFDNVDPSIYFEGESAAVDSTFQITARGLGLIGDAYSCFIAQCPSGNDTQSWYALNDGGFDLSRYDMGAMQLLGFDISFVPPFPIYAPDAILGRLLIDSFNSMGQWIGSWSFDLPAQNQDGNFYFAHVDVSSFAMEGHLFRFSSCTFDSNLDCVAPNENLNQFVIDNIHVPAGDTLALLAIGFAAFGAMRRRRV